MATIIGLTFDKPAPTGYICPHCGKEYKTGDGMERHVRKEHPEATTEATPGK